MSPLLWLLQWLLPEPCLQLHCRQQLASMEKTWYLLLQPPCTPQHQACAVLQLPSLMHCAADLDPPRVKLVCTEEHGRAGYRESRRTTSRQGMLLSMQHINTSCAVHGGRLTGCIPPAHSAACADLLGARLGWRLASSSTGLAHRAAGAGLHCQLAQLACSQSACT